jgi:hypothetical protein
VFILLFFLSFLFLVCIHYNLLGLYFCVYISLILCFLFCFHVVHDDAVTNNICLSYPILYWLSHFLLPSFPPFLPSFLPTFLPFFLPSFLSPFLPLSLPLSLGGILEGQDFEGTSTVELFDPNEGCWKTGPSLTVNRFRLRLFVVENALYAVGGDRDERGEY